MRLMRRALMVVVGGVAVLWAGGVVGQEVVKLGPEFQVNTYTTNGQGYYAPAVAADADGDFVVVWMSNSQDGSEDGVFGQRYDSGGTKQGTEFQVNTYTSGGQGWPAVAADADGDFVVVWASLYQDGSDWGAFGQRFELSSCGDGIVDSNEDCDGVDLNGQNCTSVGLGSGTLACDDACYFDTSACTCGGKDSDGDGTEDFCDPCPALKDNPANCVAEAELVCEAGRTMEIEAGNFSMTMTIPPGALDECKVISLTDDGPRMKLNLGQGTNNYWTVSARPEYDYDPLDPWVFNVPVTVTIRWSDRLGDGEIDRGQCQNAGSDNNKPCDNSAECNGDAGSCVDSDGKPVTSGPLEQKLVLKRNSAKFSKEGFGESPFNCGTHLPFACQGGLHDGEPCEGEADPDCAPGNCVVQQPLCGPPVADCNEVPGNNPGNGKFAVANCCYPGKKYTASDNPEPNEWTFQTCSFSELFLGENSGDLIPSTGSAKKNCVAEWAVDNPMNEPYADKKGFPNFKQTCMDGDPVCDKDGAVDGKCVFSVGVCLNVDDTRLLDKNGAVACTPSDVEIWKLKKPRPDSRKPVEAANAVALRNAVLALGAGVVGGKHQEEITFSPAVTEGDVCTVPVLVEVPLKGKNLDRKGKAVVKMQSITTPPVGKNRGTKDTDKIKLTCLPYSGLTCDREDSKCVFVTSQLYTSDFGGLAGADQVCQEAADSGVPGLRGKTFKAWLSDDTTDAAARLAHSTEPYRLVDGTLVANDWTDLTDGTISNSILKSELRTEVADNAVWTSTQTDGTYYPYGHCDHWTGGGTHGTVGSNRQSGSGWTVWAQRTCGFGWTAHLYCFEQ